MYSTIALRTATKATPQGRCLYRAGVGFELEQTISSPMPWPLGHDIPTLRCEQRFAPEMHAQSCSGVWHTLDFKFLDCMAKAKKMIAIILLNQCGMVGVGLPPERRKMNFVEKFCWGATCSNACQRLIDLDSDVGGDEFALESLIQDEPAYTLHLEDALLVYRCSNHSAAVEDALWWWWLCNVDRIHSSYPVFEKTLIIVAHWHESVWQWLKTFNRTYGFSTMWQRIVIWWLMDSIQQWF